MCTYCTSLHIIRVVSFQVHFFIVWSIANSAQVFCMPREGTHRVRCLLYRTHKRVKIWLKMVLLSQSEAVGDDVWPLLSPPQLWTQVVVVSFGEEQLLGDIRPSLRNCDLFRFFFSIHNITLGYPLAWSGDRKKMCGLGKSLFIKCSYFSLIAKCQICAIPKDP